MSLAVAFAVLPVVAADAFFVSPPAVPSAVFPAPGTVLPQNGRVLVADVARVLVTHDDGRVEDLAVGEPSQEIGSQRFGAVTPALREGETITLERVCDGCATSEPLNWVVGTVDDSAPVFVDAAARAERVGEGWTITVIGRVDPAEEALLHIVADDVLDDTVWQVEPGVWSLTSFVSPERELCVDIVAIDAAGNAGEPQTTCVDLIDLANPLHVFGCASTGATGSTLFAVFALALALRRRCVKEA